MDGQYKNIVMKQDNTRTNVREADKQWFRQEYKIAGG